MSDSALTETYESRHDGDREYDNVNSDFDDSRERRHAADTDDDRYARGDDQDEKGQPEEGGKNLHITSLSFEVIIHNSFLFIYEKISEANNGYDDRMASCN